MRALLDLMRENKAAVQRKLCACRQILQRCLNHLQVLDPRKILDLGTGVDSIERVVLLKSVFAELGILLELERANTLGELGVKAPPH